MVPVTTRLAQVESDGVGRVLRTVFNAGVPGALLEAPDQEHALRFDATVLADFRPSIAGVIAPIDRAPSSLATVAHADPAQAADAADAIVRAAAAVAPLGARNVIAVVGAAGLSDAAAARAAREKHVATLCRRLHAVARAIAPQRLLVLPGPDPQGILDVETTGWVLDDLVPLGVSLALDSGWTWAGEGRGGPALVAFLERHASRLGFLLVSDHDGRGCGEVLPGAGCGDLLALRDAIGKRTPRAVRPDPVASLADVLASAGLVSQRLGAVGDVVGW